MSHLCSPVSKGSPTPRPRFCPKRLAPFWLLALLISWATASCAESLSLEVPGDDVLMYQPRSMATLDNNTVYLVNTNYDRRFSAGWISAIDVAQIVQALDANTSGTNAITRQLMVPRLGGRMVFDSTKQRAFLPHSGAGILTVLELETTPTGRSLSCDGTGDRSDLPTDLLNTSCDRDHLIDLIDQAWQQDTTRKRTDFSDPAAVAYLPPPTETQPATLLVGYLGFPMLTSLSLPAVTNTSMARVVGASLSAPNFSTSAARIRHLEPALAVPNTVYISGASGDGSTVLPFTASGGQVTQLAGVDMASAIGSSIVERTLVSPVDSNVIYALNRLPDQIATIKRVQRPVGTATSTTPVVPSAALQLQAEVVSIDGSQPFDLVYAQRSIGEPTMSDIVAVVGVAKNTVYFLQPTPNGLRLVGRLPLESNRILSSPTPALEGGGPGGIAYVNARGFGTPTYTDLLFVSNYYSHTLSVIDISSRSAAGFKEVLRIEGNNLGPSLRYP